MAGIRQIRPGNVTKTSTKDNWLPLEIEATIVDPGRAPSQGVFYPSSLGNPCDRYLYYAYKGMLPALDVNPKLQRIFDHGNTFEDRMEKYLVKADLFKDREVPAKYQDPPISGRMDFLITSQTNRTAILELKTIKSSLFSKLSAPKPEHMVQIQLYLHTTEYEIGYVLYENKDNQEWKCFKIIPDDKMWSDIVDRCHRIMNMKAIPEKCTGEWYCDCKKVTPQGKFDL